MSAVRLGPLGRVRARLEVPGDKSISHRALILNAVAEGRATVRGLGPGHDVAATATALAALGVGIELGGDRVRIGGGGRWSAAAPIDCGNAGTTARLLLGLLAPRARGTVVLAGDRSLSARPMGRVVEPLARMGAAIEPAEGDGRPPDRLPLAVRGRQLSGRHHRLEVASAQVKSALLLAGLAADGATVVEEPGPSRDHTERLLAAMGAAIEATPGRVALEPGPLGAIDVDVPGDLSSAAPFLALAAAIEGSDVVVERVGLNPGRTGFLDLLRAFGADVEIEVERDAPEPVGRVRVRGRGLVGIEVDPALVPRAIDELPLVAVLATGAEGETRVAGAAELRVKESDRIAAIAAGLERMGAAVEVADDGFRIGGPVGLRGAALDASGDHRIGMALAVAAGIADGDSTLEGAEWAAVSYPGFWDGWAGLAAADAVG